MANPGASRSGGESLRVLVAGGGVAAAELLSALQALAAERVETTLLCPQDELTYRPLSVKAPFASQGRQGYSIDKLAADSRTRRVRGSLAWVAPSGHTAFTAAGVELHYDVLVIATGAVREPAFPHALTFRGYEDSQEMRALVEDVEHGRASRVAFVVPPGAGW